MEKIVVLTGDPSRDSKLLKCLKAVFPECEIDIQHKMPKNYNSVDLLPENDDLELNEDTEKYLSFL